MKIGVLLFTSLLFLSCSTDDESVLALSISERDVLGRWKVTDVVKTSGETTENLDGFVFEFKENNELIITNEAFLIEGTWHIVFANAGLKLLIPTKDQPLRMFHNQWKVTLFSNSYISLSGFSNENDGFIHYIKFEKL